MERPKMILGIDPGISGGMAYMVDGITGTIKMPPTPLDIYQTLSNMKKTHDVTCYIEKVGYHRQGNNASASCKFAHHVGCLEMALMALGIPQRQITPNKWMKAVCGALPKDKQARKNAIKAEMQRRHPDLKVTLATADALGLMEYGIMEYSTATR